MTLTSKKWLMGAGVVSVGAIASTLFSLEHDWHLFSITTLMIGGTLLFVDVRQSLAAVMARPQQINRQYLLDKLQQVEQAIAKLADPSKRQTLSEQAQQITNNLQKNHFRIVVFGMGAAGKTSLINALLGARVGKNGAEIGTSDRKEYGYRDASSAGFNFINPDKDSKLKRQISLLDTSGLQEMGAIGQQREKEAIQLAQAADLLVFVTVGDLTSIEYRELTNLAKLGKRVILAFNKTDLYLPSDRTAILSKLKASTYEFLAEQDIVAIAAQPSPIKVTVNDETLQEWWENMPPDIGQLRERIESILSYEWEELLIHNTELQIESLLQQIHSSLNAERRQNAKAVIERYQIIAATTVFANPIPALDLLAGAAINTQMLIDLGKIYECPISFKQSQQFAITIAKQLVQLGCVEIATSAIASCLKVNAITYAIGGSLQAATAAYLTHIGGNSFLTYLEQNPQLAIEKNWQSVDNLLALQKISQRTFQALQSDRFVMDFVSIVSNRLSQQFAEHYLPQERQAL
ncbi:MAG: hypothetical protein AUK48_07000 [Oscillatoriales cyanobacterium CG2_30_44_21]|nr:MAG: hypothetical protein AUK48_07000 [Oscillatoriales cyanobacterium CG2_30_44_21]